MVRIKWSGFIKIDFVSDDAHNNDNININNNINININNE